MQQGNYDVNQLVMEFYDDAEAVCLHARFDGAPKLLLSFCG